MPTLVSYNSNRIIPAPHVSISKSYQTTGDGTKIGSLYSITLSSKILAFMGSPLAGSGVSNDVGSFYDLGSYPSNESFNDSQRLGAILRKQQQLRDLFSEDGHLLEIQSADGTPALKCNPRVISIDFPEDSDIQWFNYFQYTISLECDGLYANGLSVFEDDFSQYISSASESWNIETLEEPESLQMPRTYRLTHSISATGKRFFDVGGTLSKSAYQQARDFVLPRMGFNSSFLSSSGVQDLPSYYQGLNHIISENIDELGGEYSITETWILASGRALEEFNVSTQNSLQDGLTSVSINGTITGLELRDANQNVISYKIDNAEDKFSAISGIIYSRAQTYSDVSLNMIPISTTVGKNPITGTISYDYQYNNRPTNFVSAAKYESIEIIDDFGGSIVAAISVPYRTQGPVLQDIGTKKESTRTLSVELILGPQSSLDVPTSINSDVSSLISQASPQGVYQSFLVDNTQSWNPKEGRLSITKTWLYEA